MSACAASYWWGVATLPIALLVGLVAGLVLYLLEGDEVAVIERHGEPDKDA